MSLKFNYTIDQVKDCINETERQLRDLISAVVSLKYGSDWEFSSRVWNEETRQKLELRRKDEQGRFPHQTVSQRLLDYTEIVELINIIDRNWDLFAGIFLKKEKIMHRFEDLHSLRNPAMHGRNLLLYQQYLCLGCCGEILSAIDYWRQGYKHKIKEYLLEFRFPVYLDGKDKETAQKDANMDAEQWVTMLHGKMGGKLEERTSKELAKSWRFIVDKTHVSLTMMNDYAGYDGRKFRAASITVRTFNEAMLSQIVTAAERPYWFFEWRLADDLDVSSIISLVADQTGNEPVSSTQITNGSKTLEFNHAEYALRTIKERPLRITLTRWQPDRHASIGLIYDGGIQEGFYQVHQLLSVSKMLSILYGEVTLGEVKYLVEQIYSPV